MHVRIHKIAFRENQERDRRSHGIRIKSTQGKKRDKEREWIRTTKNTRWHDQLQGRFSIGRMHTDLRRMFRVWES